MLFPLETSIPATLFILISSSSWICLATSHSTIADQSILMMRARRWLNLHKSNAGREAG